MAAAGQYKVEMEVRQITPARRILGKLFNGNGIPPIPVEEVSEVLFEFKGIASIGRLVTGRAKGLVYPTLFSKWGKTVLCFDIQALAFAA